MVLDFLIVSLVPLCAVWVLLTLSGFDQYPCTYDPKTGVMLSRTLTYNMSCDPTVPIDSREYWEEGTFGWNLNTPSVLGRPQK